VQDLNVLILVLKNGAFDVLQSTKRSIPPPYFESSVFVGEFVDHE